MSGLTTIPDAACKSNAILQISRACLKNKTEYIRTASKAGSNWPQVLMSEYAGKNVTKIVKLSFGGAAEILSLSVYNMTVVIVY
jgi:hypothetical protein